MISQIKRMCNGVSMDFAGRFTPLRRRRFDLLSVSTAPAKGVQAAPSYAQKPQLDQTPSQFEQLPLEVMAECLSFLTVRDIGNIARTSKKMKNITEKEIVWRMLCRKYFNCDNILEDEHFSWKAYFEQASRFEWDKDNSTMESENCKNRIVRTDDPFYPQAVETATSCSSQLLTHGRYCIEFVVNNSDNNYKVAVGLIGIAEGFNFAMSSYGDGETMNTPTTTLNQCFYWSDGQFSDILGNSVLTGTFDFNTNADPTYQTGDVIGVVVDMDVKSATFYKNYTIVARYAFIQNGNNSNSNNSSSENSNEEENELVLNIAAYLPADGDSVTARFAPFHLYE